MESSTHRLRTLGALDLRAADGTELRAVLAQPRRIALLVYLALATPRGPQRRDRLLALFWPDQDDPHARNALNQAVHFLRRALGSEAITGRTGDELGIDPRLLWCDALAFDDAITAHRPLDAVELYRGELLAGFHVPAVSAELVSWLEEARADYARRYAAALRTIAAEREAARDFTSAIDWRRRLAAQDPLNADAALELMRALAASGDAAGAIRHARVHEALARNELGAAVDARITALAKTLQEQPDALRVAAPAPPVAIASSTPAAPAFTPDVERAPAAVPPPPPLSHPAPAPPAARARRTRIAVAITAGLAALAAVGSFVVTGARAPALTPNCIAVLPFSNYTGNAADDDVADALTDALITELARYPTLSVISRSSVARYRKTTEPLPQIGRELRCGTAMSGSISRDGGRILVDAQLLDAERDRNVWAERFTRPATELPDIPHDIGEVVAMKLGAAKAPADSTRPTEAAARAVDPITYGIYLRGRDATLSRDPAGLERAINLFKQALLRDSAFAPAWSGLADAYRLAGGLGFIAESFYSDSAPRAAARAVALDPRLSVAHSSRAAILTDAADWVNADAEYRRAIELEPGNALAHQWYAAMLITLDRKEEALREIRRAVQLDPLSQSVRGLDNMIENYEGIARPRGVIGATPGLARTRLVDPNHPGTRSARAVTLARRKQCPAARAEIDTAQMLAPGVAMVFVGRAGVELLCGDRAKAMATIAEVKKDPRVYVSGVYVAEFYVAIGERDSAFAWLDRTHYGMGNRMNLRMSPGLAPLRSDPRWAALLQREHMK